MNKIAFINSNRTLRARPVLGSANVVRHASGDTRQVRSGLTCTWRMDSVTGRLVCCWSAADG
ncbi:hypothetical protein SAMN05519103_02386 [Rhizobiales bacterium GAS113]|jgi:hypothetical protein|nr:hypothetical protein SAMN05519103_02386 [Rhizobiales bacterium GAS113]SEB81127.1 hypothetical protein SAMN05519104_0165 [Rhizobiales bacterium GAS188]